MNPAGQASMDQAGFEYQSELLAAGSHVVTASVANQAGRGSRTWSFIVDTQAPTVTISAPEVSALTIPVRWSGQDGVSGISHYRVQVRVNAGDWTDWLTETTRTEALYVGTVGDSFRFQVQVTDKAGQTSPWVESGPVQVEAVTKRKRTPLAAMAR